MRCYPPEARLAIMIVLLAMGLTGCPDKRPPAAETEQGVGQIEGQRKLQEQAPHQEREAIIETLPTRYTKDIQGQGQLYALIQTEAGTLDCLLYEEQAPHTVDNFVGLARGLKPWRVMGTDEWLERPFYDGLAFYRVVPELLIQSGDPTHLGAGHPGYTIEDEFIDQSFDAAGVLAMAQAQPNSSGSQFFITDGPAPQFDGRYPIFGRCSTTELIHTIATTPTEESARYHPIKPYHIESIRFERRQAQEAEEASIAPAPAAEKSSPAEAPEVGGEP